MKLDDLQDPAFRKWMDFRIQTIDGFPDRNSCQCNRGESQHRAYSGDLSRHRRRGAARRRGCLSAISGHVDAIAHEYEFGDSDDHTAASRTPFDWLITRLACAASAHSPAIEADLDSELFVGWSEAREAARRHAQPCDVRADGGRESSGMRGVMSCPARTTCRLACEIFHWVAAHQDIFSGAASRWASRASISPILRETTIRRSSSRPIAASLLLLLQSTCAVPDRHGAHAGCVCRKHIDTSRRKRSQRSGVLCCAQLSTAWRQTCPDWCVRR